MAVGDWGWVVVWDGVDRRRQRVERGSWFARPAGSSRPEEMVAGGGANGKEIRSVVR